MVSLHPLLFLTTLVLLFSTVTAEERFRIKFFRFQGPNCEKMIDNEGSSVKASHSSHSAECHDYHHGQGFDGFMYYWQEHHFRGQTGSMEYGKCQIMVYSDKNCKKEVVYHLAAANLQHNFEQCADFKGSKGQSWKLWCDDWPTIGHH